MRTALRTVLGLIVVVALLAGWVVLSLRPPAPLAVPERGATLLGVTVINPGVDRRPNQRVLIDGGTIALVDDEGSDGGPYSGYYVLPGLIDMHAHFPPASPIGDGDHFPFLYLYHGVTTVRSAGDIDGTAEGPVRERIRSGSFPGPRVFGCGPFVDGAEPQWRNSRVLLDPSEAPALLDDLMRESDCIKAYNKLTPDVAAALHGAARNRGVPLIGHVPLGATFVDAHLDDVQHMMGMAVAEGDAGPFPKSLKAWRDLDDREIDRIAISALAQDKALTPTLVVIDRLAHAVDYAAVEAADDAELVPRLYRELVWGPQRDLDAADFDGIRDAVPVMQRVIKRFYDVGARLHIGTDALAYYVVPGAGMYRELALYVEAGLTPEQAWAVATRYNGADLDTPLLGTLVDGAPADLLVFRNDPTRDLAALDTLQAVIADGRLYDRATLDSQLERYQDYFAGIVFDTISVEIGRRTLGSIGAEDD